MFIFLKKNMLLNLHYIIIIIISIIITIQSIEKHLISTTVSVDIPFY
jgi:hypothetical protein